LFLKALIFAVISIMMKYLILIFALLPILGFSQIDTMDVIYMKNGNIIEGKLLSDSTAQKIKIQTRDDKTFRIYKSDIQEINQVIIDEPVILEPGTGFEVITQNQISSDMLIGFGNNPQFGFGLNATKMKHINAYFAFGLGVGMYFYTPINQLLLPINLDVKYYLKDKIKTPFAGIRFGQAFNATDKFKESGFNVMLDLGYSFLEDTGKSKYFSFGYRIQKFGIESSHFIGLTAGLSF